MRHLLDLLLLLLLLGLLLVDLLDLRLVAVVVLLVDRLLGPERDRVVDELGVLLDEVLEAALLDVLQLVLLEEARNLGATAERLALGVLLDSEGAASRRLP